MSLKTVFSKLSRSFFDLKHWFAKRISNLLVLIPIVIGLYIPKQSHTNFGLSVSLRDIWHFFMSASTLFEIHIWEKIFHVDVIYIF